MRLFFLLDTALFLVATVSAAPLTNVDSADLSTRNAGDIEIGSQLMERGNIISKPSKKYKCPYCGSSYATAKEAKDCSTKGMTCKAKRELALSEERDLADNEVSEFMERGNSISKPSKKYKCPYCGSSYATAKEAKDCSTKGMTCKAKRELALLEERDLVDNEVSELMERGNSISKPSKKYKCPYCGSSYATAKEAKDCSTKGMTCKAKRELALLEERDLADNEVSELMERGNSISKPSKKYKCPYCGSSYATAKEAKDCSTKGMTCKAKRELALLEERDLVDNEVSELMERGNIISKPSKKYKCPYCGSSYATAKEAKDCSTKGMTCKAKRSALEEEEEL